MNNGILQVVYLAIILWLGFSVYYIYRLWKLKDTNQYNPYIYNSIPSVFTTLGVLGTFMGIFFGLQRFDVNNINESIPTLLEGMKTAFSTSIIGIIFSIIFRTVGQMVLRSVERQEPPKQNNELAALSEIVNVLRENKAKTDENLTKLYSAILSDNENSISTQLIKLRNQTFENFKEQEKQNYFLHKIQISLTGEEETSLLTQFEKLRAQINDQAKENKDIFSKINDSIIHNDESLTKKMDEINEKNSERHNALLSKFDDFGEILKDNNTKALVEVMQQATETFNAQMSELIEKLVKENFEELNSSVQRLNTWQQENKEMISSLTEQFVKVSKQFEFSATSLKEITENTEKLTNENGQLARLIQELQKVMIEDTKYQEIIEKLTYTIDKIKENTETFEETTNKLNDWILKEHNFKQSVDILITRLEEIEKIKEINGEFWNQTKTQLNEGVALISNATSELRNNLDNISEEFTEQLNQTLTSLDELIQRLVKHYAPTLN